MDISLPFSNNVYEEMQECFDPKEFADANRSTLNGCSKALQHPWYILFALTLQLIANAVGEEIRWFGGCYDHEDTLKGTTPAKRRRIQLQTGCMFVRPPAG